MKLLHSADWHLDAPLQSRTPHQAAALRSALLDVPRQAVALARAEGCSLMLLSGDLFDGAWQRSTLALVQRTLGQADIPVFIAPGNHDPYSPGSPWAAPGWPENVHIFREQAITSCALPGLNCRVWGAAFQSDCSGPLLEGFRAEGPESCQVMVLHGDPTQPNSDKNPITQAEVSGSRLQYLALGHIHKGGSFRIGGTLCAWPGCPQGRGFDELGEKGALVVSLDGSADIRFVPFRGPRFHWLTLEAGPDPAAAIAAKLPAAGSLDHYRIELTGESEPPELTALSGEFPLVPNLELLDSTVPPLPLWENADEDSLEGVYFGLLRQALAEKGEAARLAARISRQILRRQEVKLP